MTGLDETVTEEVFLEKLGVTSSDGAGAEQPLYNGSCHCGFVSYAVRLDLINNHPLAKAILTRCNCTVCVKLGLLSIIPSPAASFNLMSPPEGRDALNDYRAGGKVHRFLCPKCGVPIIMEGKYSHAGMTVSYLRINAGTLDSRADGGEMPELKDLKMGYYGGRDPSCIAQGTKEKPWPKGLW